jgi:hypothetical protein
VWGVKYPLSLLLNVPPALVALLAGLFMVLLDGWLAGRARSYRVRELVRSRYLLAPLLLAVLNPLLGVLGGAGSALLAHHRRGAPEQRNLPAAFSLSLFLLVGYPAFLFVLGAQNSEEPTDFPRPEGPRRLAGVTLPEVEGAARSFGLECTDFGAEGPVLAVCRAGPADEPARYEVGILGESGERVGIVNASVRGCDAEGFDRARAVDFLGEIASTAYEDEGKAAEARRWVERNAFSGGVKTEGGTELNLASGCEEAGVISLSVQATGYVPGGYPPESDGGIEGGLLGLIVTPLFVASSFSLFFLAGGPLASFAAGGLAHVVGILAGVSLGYLVVRSPALRKPFAGLAALVLAAGLALIVASPEWLLTAGALPWGSERLLALSAVPGSFALGFSIGLAFAALRGLILPVQPSED